jgi:hypothetical protein
MPTSRALEGRIAIHCPFMDEVFRMTATDAQVRLMMKETKFH